LEALNSHTEIRCLELDSVNTCAMLYANEIIINIGDYNKPLRMLSYFNYKEKVIKTAKCL